jgi:N-acetylmuramoyl-L-alanine amidase
MTSTARIVLQAMALLAAVLWPAIAAATGIVTAARVVESEQGLRFEMEMTRTVEAKVSVLGNPYRVVVDLPTMEFRVPQGTGLQSTGFVKEFRYGLVGTDRARVVFDLDSPTLAGKPRVTAGVGETVLFSLDLSPTDKDTFAKLIGKKPKPKKLASADPVGIVPKPKPADPRQAKPLIVIDAGHGGPDSGAVSPGGQLEKNLVLAIAKALRDQLNKSGRYKVHLTRDKDVFIPLKGRVDIAQKRHADLFVSIHADSTARGRRWQPTSGGTVYTRANRATDEQSRLLALKENAADAMAGEDRDEGEDDAVSSFGVDLARQETTGLTKVLAESLVGILEANVPMTDKAHREAAFYVLRSPEVPSVLIETGYMNNKKDAGNLTSPEWRQAMAEAIAKGIDEFFSARDSGMAAIFGVDP